MVFRRSGERDSVYETDADAALTTSGSAGGSGSSGVALTESDCINATRNEFFHRLGRVQRGDHSGGVREHVPSAPPPICPSDDDCSAVPLPPTEAARTSTKSRGSPDEHEEEQQEEEEEEEEVDPELGAPLLVGGRPAPPTRSFLRGSSVSLELGGLRTSSVTSFR
jgi:hypothetical protein